MTHNVHPYAQRLGILRDWKSRWFSKTAYRDNLEADVLLRAFLEKKLKGTHTSDIEMERDEKTLRVIIKTSRPGIIIGRGGEGTEQLRNDIVKFLTKKKFDVPASVKVDIEEVKSPESNARLVAQMVAEGLEKRMPFRRVLKQTVEKVDANRDVEGVRISLAGRLGGADMARREELKRGRIPLQTFRADVDYAQHEAHTPQGVIGIKVWIYKGEVYDDQEK